MNTQTSLIFCISTVEAKRASNKLPQFRNAYIAKLCFSGQIFAVGLSTTTPDCSDIGSHQVANNSLKLNENLIFYLTNLCNSLYFQKDLVDKERFNTTVLLSHVTPGPAYVFVFQRQ